MREPTLTVHQPYASAIMVRDEDGDCLKGVENRSWAPPASSLPQWGVCPGHGRVLLDYPPDGHIADDGPQIETGMGHAAGCHGDCENYGCPVPVPVQADPRYPCGPIEPDGPYPARLWIHAGTTIDTSAAAQPTWEALRDAWGMPGEINVHDRLRSLTGVLLGPVRLTSCHHADECARRCLCQCHVAGHTSGHSVLCRGDSCGGTIPRCSRFAEPGLYHWLLDDPRPLRRPIPMRGHQRLWDLTWHLDPEEVPAHA